MVYIYIYTNPYGKLARNVFSFTDTRSPSTINTDIHKYSENFGRARKLTLIHTQVVELLINPICEFLRRMRSSSHNAKPIPQWWLESLTGLLGNPDGPKPLAGYQPPTTLHIHTHTHTNLFSSDSTHVSLVRF